MATTRCFGLSSYFGLIPSLYNGQRPRTLQHSLGVWNAIQYSGNLALPTLGLKGCPLLPPGITAPLDSVGGLWTAITQYTQLHKSRHYTFPKSPKNICPTNSFPYLQILQFAQGLIFSVYSSHFSSTSKSKSLSLVAREIEMESIHRGAMVWCLAYIRVCISLSITSLDNSYEMMFHCYPTAYPS